MNRNPAAPEAGGDAKPDAPPKGAAGAPVCALCGKPRAERYRPFCSKRCADVDLARWLGGTYAIAGSASDEEDLTEPPGGERR